MKDFISIKKLIALLVMVMVLLPSTLAAQVEMFEISDVRLLESPFKHAQDKNIEYLLALEPDKLLAPFLIEAGLKPKLEGYGNWENTGLNGHIGGHYLTALSLAWAATGDERMLNRLNYMLGELERAQSHSGNGYIGGIPNGKKLWEDIAQANVRADLFSLNEYWVPWYNLHKTYAGLRDAWVYTGNEKAKTMLLALADWTWLTLQGLTSTQFDHMLRTEHGGMNEVFVDIAEISGDKKYLKLAQQFSHQAILEPLLNERDELDGLHANTQIPKVVGYQRLAEVADFQTWEDAAVYFWDQVVNNRTVAIGGNSVREHFHPSNNFESMISDIEGPETCNTYNMLKLTKGLYRGNPQAKYVEYYERAIYNHILSSQHPQTGGLVYFTPMRPQHYRMYSQPDTAMWCCVGSGIENHSKYGEFIYAHKGNNLYVNLFIPSELNWAEKNIRISQTNTLPDTDTTTLKINGKGKFTLNLRYPAWVKAGELKLAINGRNKKVKAAPGETIELKRRWRNGDKVEVTLPMHIELEQMPDKSDYYAVTYGPVVLAAAANPIKDETLNVFSDDSRMGHIAQAEMCSLDSAPMFLSETPELADKIIRLPGNDLAFTANDIVQQSNAGELVLVPFFRVHDSRYMLYWPYYNKLGLAEKKATQAAHEKALMTLQQATVDKVAPGEQQPEADHFFKGDNTEAGVHKGRHWRHARNGWFSYQMNDKNAETKFVRLTYYGLDYGRSFSILINGIELAEVNLVEGHGDTFYTVDYPLTEKVRVSIAKGKFELKFKAAAGSTAGGIYGVRLMSEFQPEVK